MYFVLLGSYLTVLVTLCLFGAHRAWLVYLCFRHAHRVEGVALARAGSIDTAVNGQPIPSTDLPRVTIQLPLYNEATVAARLLEAVGRIEYPADKLEIQVLDDSSDETKTIAESKVRELASRGIDASYVRRPTREGYKAGALAYGLETAKGELIAIFDADFVPEKDFLKSIVGHFCDPSIGMVQTRWAHMNRDASALTGTQALMLDGHHLVENRARFSSGSMFNFSGTGGIWRRQAIADAGGWEHDTLTEDLDLSYRAQLAGWRFVYRPDVITPAELPEEMSAFRAQQFRWAKGTVQACRKLLGRVWGSPLSRAHKIEATFHLIPHFAYPLLLLLSVLLLPALIVMPATDTRTMLLIDLPLCFGTTGSLATFYALAQTAQGGTVWSAIRRLPMVIALGVGLAPHQTKAVWSGVRSMAGEFVRTPKRGAKLGESATRYVQVADLPLPEIALSLISLCSVMAAIETEHWFAIPFAGLFCFGYSYVAAKVISEQLEHRRASLVPAFAAEGDRKELEGSEVARAA